LLLPLCVPVLIAAAYGQSVFFAGACLVAAMAQLERRPRLAGCLIAVAMCLKPQIAVLAPLAMWGSWRAATAALAAGAALVAASLAFGPGHWLQWLAALPQFTALVARMRLPLVSLLGPELWAPQTLIVAGAGVGFAAWSVRRDPAQRVVGVVCGSLCCASYAVRPDLAALAPSALAWMLGSRTTGAWLRRIAGGALILGLVAAPVGVALFMLAAVAAERVRAAPQRANPGRRRWRPGLGASASPS
jgi:Glycosyltransferase family 87